MGEYGPPAPNFTDEDGSDRHEPCAGCTRAALNALAQEAAADALEAQARRLTEQDAEIARLREDALLSVCRKNERDAANARADAAEQALTAARRERCGEKMAERELPVVRARQSI